MKINNKISIFAALSLSFTLGIGLAANMNASHKEMDAYTDIPVDKPLFPAVILYDKDDSVEIIKC